MAFRPKNLHSRVALVSGGNRGIGYEVCHKFHQMGAHVVLGSRDRVSGAEAVSKIISREGWAHHHAHHNKDTLITLPLDVTSPSNIKACVAEAVKAFGRVDYLINNAAIFKHGWTKDVFDEVMLTDFWGVVHLTEACLDVMKKEGFGRIVNVSSGYGRLTNLSKSYRHIFERHANNWKSAEDMAKDVIFNPDDDEMANHLSAPTYRLAKAMVNHYTVLLAKRLLEEGFDDILVNAVDPGWVRTSMGGPHAPTPVGDAADVIVTVATAFDDPHFPPDKYPKRTGSLYNVHGELEL